jgi:hypothetical protein
MGIEYLTQLGRHFDADIASYKSAIQQLSAKLPDSQVYDDLRQFGSKAAQLPDYATGSSYGEYLIVVATDFANQVLALDPPQSKAFEINLLRETIGLNDRKTFHLKQQLLIKFWRSLARKLKESVEKPMDSFQYNAEQAEHDVVVVFRLMNFFMFVERTFGMKDTVLAKELLLIRDSFDSIEPDKGLLGKFQSKILLMLEQPEWKLVEQKFKESNNSYDTVFAKSTLSEKLLWAEYSKALKLMSDVAAVAQFDEDRKKISSYEYWLKRFNAKLIELKVARDAALARVTQNIKESRERLFGEKWSLSLLKLNPPSAQRSAAWDRVSDLIVFKRTD